VSEREPRPSDDERPEPPARAAYEPPRVRHVEIAIQEAIMSICKGGTSGGPFGPGCGGCRGGGS